MEQEYYPIYSIRFTKKQMRFLIDHLAELRNGEYPQPYRSETGYIDPAIRGKHFREPSRNRVLELAAEVEARLDLVMNYISGWNRPTGRVIKRNGR